MLLVQPHVLPWLRDGLRCSCPLALALCLSACAPRGPEPVPEGAREVVRAVEQALEARDYETAKRYVDFRYRLAEMLGTMWQGGPEPARVDLEARLAEMFVETSDNMRERSLEGPHVLTLLRRDGTHLWVASAVTRNDEPAHTFAWHYRLTPRGTSWAITQREYLIDGMPSDSTRFWPMALKQVALQYGRAPNLSELAANLPSVMGTMRIRRFQVPTLCGPPNEAPTQP
jgi:hypothetical protein